MVYTQITIIAARPRALNTTVLQNTSPEPVFTILNRLYHEDEPSTVTVISVDNHGRTLRSELGYTNSERFPLHVATLNSIYDRL